jgi:NitT/TauT family transport system substrate-binding protein
MNSLRSRICRFGFTALALFATPLAMAQAQAPVEIKMAIDWTFQGPSAMFLHGLDQKFFEQEGIRLTIDRGFGSADAVTKVASGAYQFTLGDTSSMVEFNARNPDKPVIAIYMMYSRAPFSVVTLADRGINSPKDLEGRKVASNEGLAAGRVFPLFAKGAGIDAAKIAWVNVAPPMLDTIVIQKTADAGLGFWTTQSLNMKAANVPAAQLKRFFYADYGVELYGNAILTTKAYAAANPDVVKRFNRAILRSFKAMSPDPSVSMAALKRREPTTIEPIEFERLALTLDNFVFTEEAKKVGLGAVDPARMERAIDQLMTVLKLQVRPKAEDVFSAAYLPDLKDRMLDR